MIILAKIVTKGAKFVLIQIIFNVQLVEPSKFFKNKLIFKLLPW